MNGIPLICAIISRKNQKIISAAKFRELSELGSRYISVNAILSNFRRDFARVIHVSETSSPPNESHVIFYVPTRLLTVATLENSVNMYFYPHVPEPTADTYALAHICGTWHVFSPRGVERLLPQLEGYSKFVIEI